MDNIRFCFQLMQILAIYVRLLGIHNLIGANSVECIKENLNKKWAFL